MPRFALKDLFITIYYITMLTIDGSIGEGGGQILRSALALSMVGAIITHTFGFSSHLPTPGTRVYCPETREEGP